MWTRSAWRRVTARIPSSGAAYDWCVGKLLGLRKGLTSWVRPPADLEGRDETERWAASYAALRDDSEDGTYALAREYAKERYDEMVKASEDLDKKLDDLAKAALAVGGIVATIARVIGLDPALFHSPSTAMAIVFSVLTVVAAALTRRPNKSWRPMNARTILEVADLVPNLPKGRIEAAAAASYHFATNAMTASVEWKGDQLRRATWLFCISLALIAFAVIFPRFSPSSRSSETPQTASTSRTTGVAP